MIENGLICSREEDHKPTNADMGFIRKYLRNLAYESECFVFKIKICNNAVDRDFERFGISALQQMSDMFLGKSVIVMVNNITYYPRIFCTWLETHKELVENTVEPLCELWAKVFLIIDPENEKVIQAIQSGRFREVSVGCSISRTVCNICGKECCKHNKGIVYNGVLAHRILIDPKEVYELSIIETIKKSPLKVKVRKIKRNNKETRRFLGQGGYGEAWATYKCKL